MSYTEHTIAALHELALCVGSLEAGARRAGFSKSYLPTLRKRKSMPMGTLDRFFEAFRVDPVRFAAWAEAGAVPPPVARFGAEALDLAIKHGEPEPVRRIRLAYLRGELEESAMAEEITALDAADALREHDAGASLRAALPLAESTNSAETAARAMGVCASALRALRRLDEAHVLLWSSIRLMSALKKQRILANLEQRAAYVVMDRGQYSYGADLAETSGVLFTKCGDQDGLGRALVAQAIMHRYGGLSDRAMSCFRRALRNLSVGSSTYRATAFHGLGTLLLERGDLENAESQAEKAARLWDPSTVGGARLCWLRARISFARGQIDQAVAEYEKAASGLRQLPGDACLVAAELIRVLMKSGRMPESRTIAQDLGAILFRLDKSAPERAGALDLWRAAQETDRFTITVVESALRRMTQRGKASS